MSKIARYKAYGAIFIFEPPVEVGDREVYCLERLGAIALIGHTANEGFLHMEENNFTRLFQAIPNADPDKANTVAIYLNTTLTQTVTLE